MAYPGDVQRGDTVRWHDYLAQKEREGVVVRCAKDGMWVDVRYPIEPSVYPEITYLTRRVRITKLRVVRKSETAPVADAPDASNGHSDS